MTRAARAHRTRARGLRRLLSEGSGACGDLGTFIPHVVGAIAVAGLAPAGVLFGFGAFLVATGLFYGLPLPVQPMKAVSAVILADGLGRGEVIASGVILGAVLVVLGATGAVTRIARLIPQSVSAGLQLGLGLLMGVLGARLIGETPVLGLASLVLLLLLMRLPHCPAALITIALAVATGVLSGVVSLPEASFAASLPRLALPSVHDLWRSLELAVLPQLSLTLANAVIVTAALARELFPAAAAVASERNLALTSGIANLLLSPFGAMPMCHGAGGLQAQYRFGARSGLAPVLLGLVLLVLGFGFAGDAGAFLALVPSGTVGALLIVAGLDLAASRRLFDARPSCWPVIGATALATLLLNPAAALLLGCAGESVRATLLRRGRPVDEPPVP